MRGLEDEQRRLEGARHRLLGEDELRSREDVLVGLQKQYGRLKALCDGLGIEAELLEATAGETQARVLQQAPPERTQREELLIDAWVSSVNRAWLVTFSGTLADAPDRVALYRGSSDDVPLRDIPQTSGSDPLSRNPPDIRIDVPDDPAEDSRMDEEEMRIANQDVMQMQRRAMDGGPFTRLPLLFGRAHAAECASMLSYLQTRTTSSMRCRTPSRGNGTYL